MHRVGWFDASLHQASLTRTRWVSAGLVSVVLLSHCGSGYLCAALFIEPLVVGSEPLVWALSLGSYTARSRKCIFVLQLLVEISHTNTKGRLVYTVLR